MSSIPNRSRMRPIAAGDEIAINVSTGPEQREVPDVSSLSYADAVKRLSAAGFTRFKQSEAPSTREQKDKVLSTQPPANQSSAITNEITIVVGSGPATRDVPDVTGQTVDQATKNLNTLGFPLTILTTSVDSPNHPVKFSTWIRPRALRRQWTRRSP